MPREIITELMGEADFRGGEFIAYREGDDPEAVHWPKRMNPPCFGFGATPEAATDDLLTNEYCRSAQ